MFSDMKAYARMGTITKVTVPIFIGLAVPRTIRPPVDTGDLIPGFGVVFVPLLESLHS